LADKGTSSRAIIWEKSVLKLLKQRYRACADDPACRGWCDIYEEVEKIAGTSEGETIHAGWSTIDLVVYKV